MALITKRPLHHRAATSGTITFCFHLLRWVTLTTILFLLPRTRLEQLIVTVSAVIWHRFNSWSEGNRYFLTKDQQVRTQVLRGLLPTVEAVAAAHNVPNRSAKLDNPGDQATPRPALDEINQATESQWSNFWPDYESLVCCL